MHPTAKVADDHVIFEGIVSDTEELLAGGNQTSEQVKKNREAWKQVIQVGHLGGKNTSVNQLLDAYITSCQ